eukprot:jgi/Chlat1/5161/Chrsp33S05154
MVSAMAAAAVVAAPLLLAQLVSRKRPAGRAAGRVSPPPGSRSLNYSTNSRGEVPAGEAGRPFGPGGLAAAAGRGDSGNNVYVVRVLTAEDFNEITEQQEPDLPFKHGAYLKSLYDEGKLKLAGPFNPITRDGGIWVLSVPTMDDALECLHNAPFYKTGLIRDTQVYEWNLMFGDEEALHYLTGSKKLSSA